MVEPSVVSQHSNRHRRRFPAAFAAAMAGALLWAGHAAAQATGALPKADDPEPPLPMEAVQPPSRLATPPRSPEDELPDLTMSDWRLAPIRWGGNAIGIVNQFRTQDLGTTLNTSGIVNVRAASHIYQPWFAQVMGNVGLTSSKTHRTSQADGVNVEVPDVRGNSVVYGGALNLFPQSRFPFQAFVDRSNSHASGGGVTSSDYSSTRIGLRQSYRPPIGTENYGLSYDRSVFTSDASSSSVDALQGNYSVALDDQSITAQARIAQAKGGFLGESSRIFNFNGSHLWRPQDGLSVSTTAHLGDNQLNYVSAGSLGLNQNRLMQIHSTFNWIPDEDMPLSVYGGGSLINLETQTGTGQSDYGNIGAFLGMTYRFSSRLLASGNAQLAQTRSGNERFLIASQVGSLSYSGEPLSIGNFIYNWNTGGTIANQSMSGSQNAQNSQSASLQLGHSLIRTFAFSPANMLNLTLGQGVSTGTNTQTGATNTLVHSGGISWRLGYGERMNGTFGLVASDNLTRGQYSSHFRTVSINGSGLGQITRRSSVTASANLNWSQQQLDNGQQQLSGTSDQQQPTGVIIDANRARWMGSASIGYNHFSPFDIRNLLYTASFIYTSSQVNQRIIGADPNALTWEVSKAFQQRLDYRIGRLTLQVLNSFATVNGKKNASLFFQVIRSFGDF